MRGLPAIIAAQAIGLRIVTVTGDGNCFFVRNVGARLSARAGSLDARFPGRAALLLTDRVAEFRPLGAPSPQRAVCDQLEGKNGDHRKLRASVCDFIEAHPDDFAPFVEDDEPFDRARAQARPCSGRGGGGSRRGGSCS